MKSETRGMAKLPDESGFSVLETLIATTVLLIAAASVLNLFLVVVAHNAGR